MSTKKYFIDKKVMVNGKSASESFTGMANPFDLKEYIDDVISAAPVAPPSIVLATDGTAASPSITFASDSDTGIYHPTANKVGISTNGIERLEIGNSGIKTDSVSAITSGSPVTIGGGLSVGGTQFPNGLALFTETITQATSIITGVTLPGNARKGVITTVSATTAAGATSTFTVTDSAISANDLVLAQIMTYGGTISTNGVPIVSIGAVANGSFNINITNVHATNALSGVLKIGFMAI